MSGTDLFHLFPSVIRSKDGDNGPLAAVLRRFAEAFVTIEAAIEQGYDDSFLETCDAALLPYIADLIGHRSVLAAGFDDGDGDRADAGNLRREMARTIWLRRRKGTPGALPVALSASTGWHSALFENTRNVATTTSLRASVPLPGQGLPDLRQMTGPDIATPSPGRLSRVATVRRIDRHAENGRWHPQDAVLEAWTQRAYAMDLVEPYQRNGFLTFSPIGLDTQLCCAADGHHTAVLTSARAIRLSDVARSNPFRATIYGPDRAIALFVQRGQKFVPLPLSVVRFARVPAKRSSRWTIDPELGRIQAPDGVDATLRVRYFREFGGDIGGGAYRPFLDDASEPVHPEGEPTTASHGLWGQLDAHGQLALCSSESYPWRPTTPVSSSHAELSIIAKPGVSPAILGNGAIDLSIFPSATRVVIEGAFFACKALILGSNVSELVLRDVTLVDTTIPSGDQASAHPAGIDINNTGPVRVTLVRSVVGSISAARPTEVTLDASCSIIHPVGATEAFPAGIRLKLVNCTVLGQASVTPQSIIANSLTPLSPTAPTPPEGFASLNYGQDGYAQLVQQQPDAEKSGERELGAFRSTSGGRLRGVMVERLNQLVPMESRAGIVARR